MGGHRTGTALNEHRVACPSHVDRGRNPHRSGQRWTLRTVAAILSNPRYTGRQVWNRQHTVHLSHQGPAGRVGVQRWAPMQEWVISKRIAHPPLVSEAEFVAAQAIRAARPTADGSIRSYQLAGLLICGLCQRRMDAHWVHSRAEHRCRHGHTSSQRRPPGAQRYLYVRDDHLLAELAFHLADQEPLAFNSSGSSVGTAMTPADIVRVLRDNHLMIKYGPQGWTLIPIGARADPTADQPVIPP